MNRRKLLFGLGASLVAAPAVVRAASLMPVRGIVMPPPLTSALVLKEAMQNFAEHNSMFRDLVFFQGSQWEVVAINPSPRPIADESV